MRCLLKMKMNVGPVDAKIAAVMMRRTTLSSKNHQIEFGRSTTATMPRLCSGSWVLLNGNGERTASS
jgi:hypothetical protein